MNPDDLKTIPDNVLVNITSSTVFGAKFVELVEPPTPSAKPLAEGQQLDAQHVTVETNTFFQQLTSVLKAVDPVKLNETLAAISGALNGRGEKLGQTVTDFNQLLDKINPSLRQHQPRSRSRARSDQRVRRHRTANSSTSSTTPPR